MIYERGKLGEALEKFESSSDFPLMEERRKAWTNVQADSEPKKRSGITPVIGMVSLALIAGYFSIDKKTDAQRIAVEDCVGELVGRNVRIPRDGLGELQRPASVYDEQLACERNNNDPVLARKNIRHIPLGE